MLGTLKRTNCWLSLGIVVLLAMIYIGSYAVIVQREVIMVPRTLTKPEDGSKEVTLYHYRWSSLWCYAVFSPINEMERLFRARYEKKATR